MQHSFYKICFVLALACGMLSQATAQTVETKAIKRAWELGIGVSGYQMTRIGLLKVGTNDIGNVVDLNKRDLLFGGNIYAARELNRHFALDLQGTLGYTKDPVRMGKENRFLAHAALGLQWRLGSYFNSPYIDPFFRVGAGYMYKNFHIDYTDLYNGTSYTQRNEYNKEGRDRHHLIPISAGAGVNMWLNDRLGIGLQADYIVMPYKNVANTMQGTVRLMWRIGGNSKKPAPVQIPVEVEKIVEREVVKEVIKEVEKPGERIVDHTVLYRLFGNIHFEFDSDRFTSETLKVLDEIAEVLKQETGRRYCIIGCTDARGSVEYNLELSGRRAKAVTRGLIERGVPAATLKWRGVGKGMAYAPPSAPDDVRLGDRKILIEPIENDAYWQTLPQ